MVENNIVALRGSFVLLFYIIWIISGPEAQLAVNGIIRSLDSLLSSWIVNLSRYYKLYDERE